MADIAQKEFMVSTTLDYDTRRVFIEFRHPTTNDLLDEWGMNLCAMRQILADIDTAIAGQKYDYLILNYDDPTYPGMKAWNIRMDELPKLKVMLLSTIDLFDQYVTLEQGPALGNA